MLYTWDDKKADINWKKHQVTFEEAASVFNDALAATLPDSEHSIGEQRFLTIGFSCLQRVLMVAHTVHDQRPSKRENIMNDTINEDDDELQDDLKPEYDLDNMPGAVRGKYAERCAQGTNLVLLDPDVAEVFHDTKAVNDVLRQLIQLAQSQVKSKHSH